MYKQLENFLLSGDVNFNSLNGAYDPDDELDVTDSEFDDDSDYENDSEPDDEAAMNFFAQHLQNVQYEIW